MGPKDEDFTESVDATNVGNGVGDHRALSRSHTATTRRRDCLILSSYCLPGPTETLRGGRLRYRARYMTVVLGIPRRRKTRVDFTQERVLISRQDA